MGPWYIFPMPLRFGILPSLGTQHQAHQKTRPNPFLEMGMTYAKKKLSAAQS